MGYREKAINQVTELSSFWEGISHRKCDNMHTQGCHYMYNVSFKSPITLTFTSVINLLLFGWIVPEKANFNHSIKGASSMLSRNYLMPNMCNGLWPLFTALRTCTCRSLHSETFFPVTSVTHSCLYSVQSKIQGFCFNFLIYSYAWLYCSNSNPVPSWWKRGN